MKLNNAQIEALADEIREEINQKRKDEELSLLSNKTLEKRALKLYRIYIKLDSYFKNKINKYSELTVKGIKYDLIQNMGEQIYKTKSYSLSQIKRTIILSEMGIDRKANIVSLKSFVYSKLSEELK